MSIPVTKVFLSCGVKTGESGYNEYAIAADFVADDGHEYIVNQTLELSGLGSMRQWEAFGLAQKDKIHFTRKGYKLMGDMMYRAIIESYNETMMRRNTS